MGEQRLFSNFDHYSRAKIVTAPRILTIPWGRRKRVHLGQGINPTQLESPVSPFSQETALEDYMTGKPFKYEAFDPEPSTTVQVSATSASDWSDHLTVDFTASLGYSWAGASASGNYASLVQGNYNSLKISTRSRIRAGTITFLSEPALSNNALKYLRFGGERSLSEFYAAFGTHYVAGLEIGADAAALLSSTASSTVDISRILASVEGHFLGLGVEDTIDEIHKASSAGSSIILESFDSISDTVRRETSAIGSSLGSIKLEAKKAVQETLSLPKRLGDGLNQVGLNRGCTLTVRDYERACTAGFVVGLVLVPFTNLRDFHVALCRT